MTADDAIATAKAYVTQTYGKAGEPIAEVGLEEVERAGDKWAVTLGFSRPVEATGGLIANLRSLNRSLKTVMVEPDGSISSMRNAASGR